MDKQTEFTNELITLLRKYNVNIDEADEYDGQEIYSGTVYSFYGDEIDVDLKELKKLLYKSIIENITSPQ